MKLKSFRLRPWAVLAVLMLLIGSVPSWAAENAHCYIVAYSFGGKLAYITPLFIQKVKGTSYNEEEYTADVVLIQKMETAFRKHLENNLGVQTAGLTFSAHAAYKTRAIAAKRLADEKNTLKIRGLQINEVSGFSFKNVK